MTPLASAVTTSACVINDSDNSLGVATRLLDDAYESLLKWSRALILRTDSDSATPDPATVCHY